MHVPPPTRPGSNKLFYAFDQGNVRFISINTMQPLTKNSVQLQWLESELRDAQAEHKFVIPFFHVAVFSVGPHASESRVPALRKTLHPLFIKFGVKLAFQGHDHNYYRTQRDGITYIVSGGGGAGLYGADNKRLGVKGDKFALANNFSLGDVFPDELVLTTYSSPKPLKKPYQKLDQLRCPINSAAPCQVVPVP